jgi:predicted transcriptional regulator YdeE
MKNMNNTNPRIETLDRMIVAGYSFYGDPFRQSDEWTEENEIGRLWSRFMQYCAVNEVFMSTLSSERAAYEIWVQTPETQSKGFVEIFVGMPVSDITSIPYDLIVKILPPSDYAAFTLHGEEITGDWLQAIHGQWLPSSAYDASHTYSLTRYDERFKGIDKIAESIVDVYIPVQNREQ